MESHYLLPTTGLNMRPGLRWGHPQAGVVIVDRKAEPLNLEPGGTGSLSRALQTTLVPEFLTLPPMYHDPE